MSGRPTRRSSNVLFARIYLRVMVVLAVVVLLAVVARLVHMMLVTILPEPVMAMIAAGAELLYGLVAPALSVFIALLLLGAVYWVVLGGRRW